MAQIEQPLLPLEQLKALYYEPSSGLLSHYKLYQKAKTLGIKLTLKQINEFLKDQEVNQVFHQQRVKTYFTLKASQPWERVQIDLMDMSNQSIRKYKWIFCCIDVYTRYGFCIALRSKSETECVNAFSDVLKQIVEYNGFTPKQVDSDKESAFLSRSFKKLCDDYGITQNISEINDTKSKGIVERFNRTVRSIVGKYQTVYDRDWVTPLDDLMSNYNNTFHRTLQTTPNIALLNSEQFSDKYENNKRKQDTKAAKQTFNKKDIKIGDTVRVKIRKAIFDKEGHFFSKTTHKVERIEEGIYYVTSRKYGYKKYELLPIEKVEQNTPRQMEEIEENRNDEDIEDNERRRARRNNRRIDRDGINTERDVVQDENQRALRRYRKPRDLGFNIIDY